MLSMRILVILIAVICLKNRLVLGDAEANYCYAEDHNPYLRFATKTTYYFTHGLIKNTSVPNCEPMQIWMLNRHGTRNPGKDEIISMLKKLPKLQQDVIENHERGSGSLCTHDVENLKNWKPDPNLQENKGKYLTMQGEEDLKSLGTRIKNYFPELIQSNDPDDALKQKYEFVSTNTERTIKSMLYFVDGAFSDEFSGRMALSPNINETLLKAYKTCKHWLDKSNSSSEEVQNFITGSEFKQVIRDVSERLGFPEDLPYEDVLVIHNACVFEKAWYVNELSPWCAAFTTDNLKVFEYEEDLFYYYRSGYGREVNTIIGCPPLQDMFARFTKLEKGDSSKEPLGIFYFSHSSSLQLLFTSMGISKDSTPLKASNFRSMSSRKWSTSRDATFAANLAAVFYKCDSANKVRFYLNEKPLDYDGCENGVCDWEYLKQKLGPIAYNCNLDFCK